MYRRPWLEVAVYARAPVAEAPIHADMAANSDSTSRYSQRASCPDRTRSERLSTTCVWGEIGYAAITSGRQSATACATASDPSTCLRIRPLARARHREERGPRRRDVPVGHRAPELLPDRP